MGLLDRLFGGGGDSLDSAERILSASGGNGFETVEKAGPPAPGPVSLLTHPFLRGMDENGANRGLVKPFEKSAWVQRAIKHVSDPIAGVPLRFATMTSNGLKAFINPLLATFWDWPALGPEGPLSRAAVVDASVGWLKLKGEFFWVLSDNWLIPNAPRDPFMIVRPDQMKPIVTQDGLQMLGWWMRDGAGRDIPLLTGQVIHQKFWNPYDPVRGCPEYASAQTAAEADAFAGEFQRNLMKGNGDRGPMISSKSPLNDAQVAQVEAALRAKKRAAEMGMLKTTFLPADVTIQDPQIAQADAEFVASRIENRKEIYMAFGVPSSFAEQKARATSAHESDRFVLIEDTCIPTAAKVADPIAMLAMRFLNISPGDKNALTAYFDFQQHSVMLAARTERITAASALWGMGMPFAQVNAFLNLQAPSFPGDDQSYLPLQIQTPEEAQAAKPDPTEKPGKKPNDSEDDPAENDNDPVEQMIRVLRMPVKSAFERALSLPVIDVPAILDAPAVPPAPPVETKAADPEPGTDEAIRAQAWNRQVKMRRPAEKQMQKSIGRVIHAARKAVLSKLDATKKADAAPVQKDAGDTSDPTPPAPHPGDVNSILFDPATFSNQMLAAVEKVTRNTIQQAGDELRDEMGVDDPWIAPASTVLNALRDREPLIRNASNEIFEAIKDSLAEGFKNGETTDQLAARVRDTFNGITDDRAQNIAVTETGAAYGAGREASATDAGFKSKEWLSARDKKVRPDHVQADGQVVRSDGLFSVGGEQTPYPCGAGLSAAQACRCRCVVLYRPGKPE